MTPFFNPGPNPYGPPRVFLAAVGELMTEVAGEVADGLLAHGFTTERYMREMTLPALNGAGTRGTDPGRVRDLVPRHDDHGQHRGEVQAATQAVKAQLAFYGSTPAYKPVLDLHGWGDLQRAQHAVEERRVGADGGPHPRRHARRVRRRGDTWEMPGRSSARYGDMVTRVSFYAPYRMDHARIQELLAGFSVRRRPVHHVRRGRASDDEIDQSGRPGHDPGGLDPAQGGHHAFGGQGDAQRLLLGDVR